MKADRREKGRFYICSKSVLFEADNSSLPLVKYRYEHMPDPPRVSIDVQTGKEAVSFSAGKFVEIRTIGPPEAFSTVDSLKVSVEVQPLYSDARGISGLVN